MFSVDNSNNKFIEVLHSKTTFNVAWYGEVNKLIFCHFTSVGQSYGWFLETTA